MSPPLDWSGSAVEGKGIASAGPSNSSIDTETARPQSSAGGQAIRRVDEGDRSSSLAKTGARESIRILAGLPVCLKSQVQTDSDASRGRKVRTPCDLRHRSKEADLVGERKCRTDAESQCVASSEPVVVETVIPSHGRSIAETDTERRYAPICSGLRVLECLEEIDREAWCDEVPN